MTRLELGADAAAPATPAPGTSSQATWSASVALVVGSAFSQQFGAAIAAHLFPRVGVLGVVAMRLGVSGILLMAVCRPRLRHRPRTDWWVVLGFGLALTGMNSLFYEAIDRLPLGTAVTLEVLGPLALAVLSSRRLASWLWALLALAGVALLGRGDWGGLDGAGVAFALGAGALWAGYIVMSGKAGRRFARLDGLALALAAAAVLSLPVGIASSGSALWRPGTLALGASVALLSSVLPYSLELLALRTLPAGTFAILMSLMPAVAATAGYLVLGQHLSLVTAVAIVLVIIASAGAVRSASARHKASSEIVT